MTDEAPAPVTTPAAATEEDFSVRQIYSKMSQRQRSAVVILYSGLINAVTASVASLSVHAAITGAAMGFVAGTLAVALLNGDEA